MASNPRLGHHAQAPAEDTSSAANDEILLQSLIPEEIRISGIVKEDLYRLAIQDEWLLAQSIFYESPDMARTPLTDNGDTALHIATGADSFYFVQGLAIHMTPQDLEIRNSAGNTAFCIAAILGNAKLLEFMMDKHGGDLPLISGRDGMLPVHLAASSGHNRIVDLLSSDDLLGKMKDNDIQRLFLMTISNDIFGVAIKLFERHKDLLAIATNDEKLTALHILARKPSEFSSVDSPGVTLFAKVWYHVSQLKYLTPKSEPIAGLSAVLFDAIQSGNDGAARFILEKDPGQLTLLKDSRGRSPLQYAVLYRRESVLRYILKQMTVNLIIRAVDSDGNNVLHLAAAYQSHEELSRLDTKMKRALALFKEVEEILPSDLRTMRNGKGQTPRDIFYASHRELSNEVKQTAKGIANFGMPVAALIATVAFAAALTVPGDKTSAWFVVFILTNTVALFASSASIISFLSIFTSSAWFIENAFNISSLALIKLGVVFLLVSVVTMVLSFAAASFLIFGHIFKWVAYVVFSMGVIPILLLLFLQSKYADRLLNRL